MTWLLSAFGREFVDASFAKFILAGGAAAVVNILSRYGLSLIIPYVPAIIIAYLAGMGTAYVLNRRLVFASRSRGVAREMVVFAAVNVLGVTQTLVVSLILAWWLLPPLLSAESAETVAHAAGVMVPVFTSFLGHKYLTFDSRRKS